MIDPEWHRQQIERFRELQPRYQLFAELLQTVLSRAARALAGGTIVQVRAKQIPSFAEKVVRKAHKYRDPVNELTDLCGARLITQTPSQVDRLCEYIQQHFEVDWPNSQDTRMRLGTGEFGYLSVHYIVRVGRDADLGLEVPEDVLGLAAEIQVRTLLQHAWADINHDRIYKQEFEIPARWRRTSARIAALLESADHSFEALAAEVDAYARNYGAYMTRDQREREIAMLDVILANDPARTDIALKLARVAKSGGDSRKAIDTLEGMPRPLAGDALRELGHACWTIGERARGRELLREAIERDPQDAEATALLADTFRAEDAEQARRLYGEAYRLAPANPYYLAASLEYELARKPDATVTALMRPALRAAIDRCLSHAELGIDLPLSLFTAGRLLLLFGDAHGSLATYARALSMALSDESTLPEAELLREIEFFDHLAAMRDSLVGFGWARRLVLLGHAIAWPAAGPPRVPAEMSALHEGLELPVTLVTGGVPPDRQQHRALLFSACAGYAGTLLVTEAAEKALQLDGELSRIAPAARLQLYGGDGGPPSAALQYWVDLIASGVAPGDVRLVAIGGEGGVDLECHIALALGATVGAVEGSGGAADSLLVDLAWDRWPALVPIPADAATLGAFLGGPPATLAAPLRESLGRRVHEEYVANQRRELANSSRSLQEWSQLDAALQESNCAQADDIGNKLLEVGCSLQPLAPGEQAPPFEFEVAEVERLAELEHARWNVERLLSGWRWAEIKDVSGKRSPYLLPWARLPENVKEWDRQAVRKIPDLLAGAGFTIRRGAPGSGG